MFFSAIVLLFFNNVLAQDLPTPDYEELDKQLADIDTTKIISGILYERTMQLANLYNFNLSDSLNTADYNYFKQSILELYNASKTKRFVHSKILEKIVEEKNYLNYSVPIGIINTDFEILSDWENSEYQGVKFDSINQKYVQIPGKKPFYTLHTTIIAPLKTVIEGNMIEFVFDSNYLYSFEKPIKSLIADFGNDKTLEVIIDGQFVNGIIEINYETSGTKFISFKIIYEDNTELITFSSIYVINRSQPVSLFTSCSSNDTLRQDFSLTSALDFTGYKPTDPKIYPKFDYRVYYSNGNTAKKLLKPIIIIDGFDPGDKRKIEDCDCEQDPTCAAANRTNGVFDPEKHRSIVDMMIYYENGNRQYILPHLREKGFDVMIVNFPKYNTTNLFNGSTVEIDGGAYYIESNAMALVKLLTQTKEELLQNGSSNQVAIIAPSMAGQISRYALSYMEKNNLAHNVYLWVSLDSPHLGANIPLGDQGLIYRLQAVSDQAIAFYQKELSSPASQQQLIEFHRQNGNNANPAFQNAQTESQGLLSNNGNMFFQEHYNRQNSNGIANSSGWPQNLRKIAVVNGSLSGSRETQSITGQSFVNYANDSELVLSIRGFQTVRVYGIKVGKIHVASLESRFLPKDNSPIKISRFHKTSTDKPVYAGNINDRGNMDNIPGGFFDAQDQLKKSILSNTSEFVNFNFIIGTNGYWSLREFNPIHSFIPTFSALAHKYPNQSWANSLQYNLVCGQETPFDSYFGTSKNTPHTSFTKECVDWLLKELNGHPQAPDYPLPQNIISGSTQLCIGQTRTYNLNNGECELPSGATWYTSNLIVNSQSPYSITVTGVSDDEASITAIFSNGKQVTKYLYAGGPSLNYFTCNTVGGLDFCSGEVYTNVIRNSVDDRITAHFNGLSSTEISDDNNWEWETLNSKIEIRNPSFANNCIIKILQYGFTGLRVRAKNNNCGWGRWEYLTFNVNPSSNYRDAMYKVYPNPSSNTVNISLKNSENFPNSTDIISGALFDLTGISKSIVDINNNQATFSVDGLSPGIYVLKIYINGEPESHQISVP